MLELKDCERVIRGEYVFTPCENAFNQKISYWISKQGYCVSLYAFTPMDKTDLKLHLSDKYLESYINFFDEYMEKRH